ncbi:beta-phosphoglucomutase [Evansella cellulosilytica]|uniref:Beta-phosphoglucomutase n=1 Tax=Evansella cellulosilytica (strain ATCC 21833 / DSM 2522 / FERM P-1141 / JCM 9156 / N-4) TaxID=649639 RepID=E6U101_EVAC2|nr:beta-phosphoglucomutase [Evansella cellulosilytica]ADU30313.1 beta-phosphoglucomutase [Evansella cellulosilytica DSM 2522]
MKIPFEAVIFDLDGVLADTVDLHYLATKKVALEEGLPFDREVNQKLQGMNRLAVVEQLLKNSKKEYSDVEKQELGERKNVYYKQQISNLTEKDVLPGMKDFLDQLVKNKVQLAIASSSSNAKTTLSKLNIIDYFDFVVDVAKVKKMKPDPEIFLQAANELQVPPERCVAIEDSEAGIKAIMQTEMFSIGIGFSEEVKKADWHVISTKEITFKKLLNQFQFNK